LGATAAEPSQLTVDEEDDDDDAEEDDADRQKVRLKPLSAAKPAFFYKPLARETASKTDVTIPS